MHVEVNSVSKTLKIDQEITYFNQSEDYISEIVLNDWNNAYTGEDTPLARRFSDEFFRGFHLAKEEERGSTYNISILDEDKTYLAWKRTDEDPDLITIKLPTKLAPKRKTKIHLHYIVKIPSDKFTRYGYGDNGKMNLKYWFLAPARYENHDFIKYNNENLDDIANALSDYEIEISTDKNLQLTSDLDVKSNNSNDSTSIYKLSGKNRVDFSIFIEPSASFETYKNNNFEVITNLTEAKINNIQKAVLINEIVTFVDSIIGSYPFKKIIISQANYDRNPFYGLNQLPSFICPFTDEFKFEIKFLKTYLNTFLDNSLSLDNRKNSWIHDGIQVYAMMKYIEEKHPSCKMLGNASKYTLLKGFNLTNLDFNDQYSYFYMLMVRKNLDQPLSVSKSNLLKFNEQIANKYRAGLSLRFLDKYLENNIVPNSIKEFYATGLNREISAGKFETILKKNTYKDINWFFEIIVNSRAIIDYKFSAVAKTQDSIYFSLKNKTGVQVPISVYGLKSKEIVFKKWIFPNNEDSIYRVQRMDADKIALNFKNEVPEYNQRNNWKTLQNFSPYNRPLKFAFMKDLENPYYNQILYVPTITYNLYDGLSPGLRIHNKTLLQKPFIYEFNPSYSSRTGNLSGGGYVLINQNFRNSRLYNVRYSFSGSFYHYAPDAAYTKINPIIQLNFREKDFRDNRKKSLLFRYVMVNREKSAIFTDNASENYSVFNTKFFNSKTDITNHFSFMADSQLAKKFGKLATEIEYRKLFKNNHQINLRFYAGCFLYNKTNSDFFNFALDRPTDYLFDYNYYGRSESKGFFSQQLILAEGGFKSKLMTPYANQWITTLNSSFNIWNWVEVYGDIGYLKNKYRNEKFVFDSGIRFNLVTDYFEVYFPVYSSNGWEIGTDKYQEKIRFIITLRPKVLLNLFNRKWL